MTAKPPTAPRREPAEAGTEHARGARRGGASSAVPQQPQSPGSASLPPPDPVPAAVPAAAD
ncbi:hypothetical protein [Kitasatospora sp. NPDC018619]|uniref:hypothetical protein n=1 Tax=unclassified Kitasatospora TaxID=2633591 RepID=UPI00378B66C7